MRVEVTGKKLEDTILDLNHQGYIVVKSEIEDDKMILTAEKIRMKRIHEYNMDIIPEDVPVEFFSKKHHPFNSIWNGLKMKWLNF